MKLGRYIRKKPAPTLMLTSLLDMFTIILIFLIVSFNAESYEFRLEADLTLPESSSRAQLKPAVNVAVTGNALKVEDRVVIELSDGEFPEQHYEAGQVAPLVERLREVYRQRYGDPDDVRGRIVGAEQESDEEYDGFEPIVVVQADRELEYRTLYLILRSAATAGFFKYRLAIMRPGA